MGSPREVGCGQGHVCGVWHWLGIGQWLSVCSCPGVGWTGRHEGFTRGAAAFLGTRLGVISDLHARLALTGLLAGITQGPTVEVKFWVNPSSPDRSQV